jgi:hypothetical protein
MNVNLSHAIMVETVQIYWQISDVIAMKVMLESNVMFCV